MSNIGNQIRTVAFGGFHKQDVLDYITTASKESQAKLAALQKQEEEARGQRAELAEKWEETEAARQKSAAECESLRAELARRTAALEEAQRELAALKGEHERTAARLARLEERMPKLEEDAAAYARLKDHTATIELEARRKAQETMDQAQAQAARSRGELEGWLRRVQSGYQDLRTGVSATMVGLIRELERSKKALEDTAPAFLRHDQTLAKLMESEKAASPKAPEPLPLEETVESVRESGEGERDG